MSEYLQKNSELLTYELKLAGEGFSFIAGVDEVGRGPLAGPVVAAAVVITDLSKVPQVFDSKGLSEKKREELIADGFEPTPMITPAPNVKFFFVKDPNGVSVQFI